MGHDCYVDIVVPLWSVCVYTNFKDLFQFRVRSLDHAYCLCVFYRGMGDVNISRFRDFRQKFSRKRRAFVRQNVLWHISVFREDQQ